jgi:hypothetical protein
VGGGRVSAGGRASDEAGRGSAGRLDRNPGTPLGGRFTGPFIPDTDRVGRQPATGSIGQNPGGGLVKKNPGGILTKKHPGSGIGGLGGKVPKNPGGLVGKNPGGKSPIVKNPGGKKPELGIASNTTPGYGTSNYGPQANGQWNQADWVSAWNVHWFHSHPTWWNGGWYWYNPDATQWIAWVEGESIPEDTYFAPQAIRISNPESTATTLSYALNDNYSFDIQPGDNQDLDSSQTWVIEFDRGGDLGTVRYTLDSGEYYFGESNHGWELYHADTPSDQASDT